MREERQRRLNVCQTGAKRVTNKGASASETVYYEVSFLLRKCRDARLHSNQLSQSLFIRLIYDTHSHCLLVTFFLSF